jgi:hypothetical protein
MKLRRVDVENLKKELMGGEVVDLGGAGEDLVFEDDLQLEEAGMATEEISDMDTLLEEGVEDVGEVALEDEAAETEEAVEEEEEPLVVARADTAEAVGEGMLFRTLAILTSVALLLALPVVVGMSKGQPGAMARFFVDLFASAK